MSQVKNESETWTHEMRFGLCVWVLRCSGEEQGLFFDEILIAVLLRADRIHVSSLLRSFSSRFHSPRGADAYSTIDGFLYQFLATAEAALSMRVHEIGVMEGCEDLDVFSRRVSTGGSPYHIAMTQMKCHASCLKITSQDLLKTFVHACGHVSREDTLLKRLFFQKQWKFLYRSNQKVCEDDELLKAWISFSHDDVLPPVQVLTEVRRYFAAHADRLLLRFTSGKGQNPKGFNREEDVRAFHEVSRDPLLLLLFMSSFRFVLDDNFTKIEERIRERLNALSISKKNQESAMDRLIVWIFRECSKPGRKLISRAIAEKVVQSFVSDTFLESQLKKSFSRAFLDLSASPSHDVCFLYSKFVSDMIAFNYHYAQLDDLLNLCETGSLTWGNVESIWSLYYAGPMGSSAGPTFVPRYP